MKQTLKQRIIPEVDERELDRESSKVSSYVEDSLKELNPELSGSEMFGTDELFDDLEDMEDMTDDFFGDDPFSLDGADGFAGDIAFGDGPAEMPQEDSGGLLDDMSELASEKGSSRGSGGVAEKLTDMGDLMRNNNAMTGKMAGATAKLGKLFGGAGAAILLAGFGLAILSGIWSGIKKLSQHSPLLETVVSLMGMITTFLIRPFAHWIGQLLIPIMMDLLQISTEFMSISFEDGIWEGMFFLASTLLDALFSLPGMFATSIAGIGTILGGLIGLKMAKILGGVLGGILGSFIPVAGTTAGAAIGATVGATLFSILGVLAAYNIDEIIEFLRDVASSLDIVRFIALAILSPFALLAIDFFDWMMDRFEDFMEWIDGLGDTDLAEALADIFTMGDGDSIMDLVPDFELWSDIEDDWEGWPQELWDFSIWSDVFGEWQGWPSSVFSFSVWSDVRNEFTEEGGWPDRIWQFSVWSDIWGEWPGWPLEIQNFNVWDMVASDFGGWPSISWDGWGSFIPSISWNLSGFSWGSFIPSISWTIDPFPGWEDIVTGVSDTVSSAFDSYFTGSDDDSGADPSTGSSTTSSTTSSSSSGTSGLDWGGGGDSSDSGSSMGSSSGDNSFGNIPTGLASGGIVTDPLNAVIGEGSESEVVAPLSKLDSMIQSRAKTDINVGASSLSNDEREIERAFQTAFENAQDTSNEEEIVRQLKKMIREVKKMRSEMDLDVEFTDQSKWEVRE